MFGRNDTPMPWHIGDPAYVSNHHSLLGDMLVGALEAMLLTYLGYKTTLVQMRVGGDPDLAPQFAQKVSHTVHAFNLLTAWVYYVGWIFWIALTIHLVPPNVSSDYQNWFMGTALLVLLLCPLRRRVKKGVKQWVMTPVTSPEGLRTPYWLIGRMVTFGLALYACAIMCVIFLSHTAEQAVLR